jgi:hypothetical protein
MQRKTRWGIVCRVEKMYYERMIASNMGYRSAYSDAQLALCSESDFTARLPTEAAASIDVAADPDHERMQQRLQQEQARRAELQGQLQALRKSQKSVSVRAVRWYLERCTIQAAS